MTSSNDRCGKSEDVLYVKDQRRQNFHSKPSSSNGNQFRSEESSKKPFKACYRCGKPGHFKRDFQVKVVSHRCRKSGHSKPNCRVKMQESEANVVHVRKNSLDPIWEYCLTTEVLDQPTSVTSVVHQDGGSASAHAFIDYDEEWIVDSGCSHHATGNETLLSDVHPHFQKKVIMTADNSMHPVTKEGDLNDGSVLLKDVYHVPGLKKNLASVSQITDSGRYVLFCSKDVQILSNVKHVAAHIMFVEKEKNLCMFYQLVMNISRKLVIMQAQLFGMLGWVMWVSSGCRKYPQNNFLMVFLSFKIFSMMRFVQAANMASLIVFLSQAQGVSFKGIRIDSF